MRISLSIDTPLGEFVAHYSDYGLAGLDFPGARKAPPTSPEMLSTQVRRWHARTTKGLRQTVAGKVPGPLPDVDLSSGTEFQRRVWQALRRIGPGETMSYAEVAAAIGRPGAARAVGGACGANPIPVLIPCHRVLAANRRLGGFSGGLDWKQKLLAGEGVAAFPPKKTSNAEIQSLMPACSRNV